MISHFDKQANGPYISHNIKLTKIMKQKLNTYFKLWNKWDMK
jgi:hypothetical protein